ncbi:3c0630c4-6e72-4016-a3f4-6a5c357740c2 [Thermothielavioides terrestris]|uniref:3c0630c4-6e72-4016-a3f4-6a5c357740c2 n=1 Tax=Thermothielavioides terrestris TaxID=2587410 RepID=A0A446BV26_9PEZI|nr:3c0630c4-6e72-4016-a3f4-6a5c357740c2 [Thermothielavioides terrestris]
MTVSWKTDEPPSVGQLWLNVYAVFTAHSSEEAFRLDAQAQWSGTDRRTQQLRTFGFAIDHPPSSSADAAYPSAEHVVLCCRYSPHLREAFSVVALDHADGRHLDLFHVWQKDLRVAQGWNETDSREQQRAYLRCAHEDSHQMVVLARFDDTFFAHLEPRKRSALMRCSRERFFHQCPLNDNDKAVGGTGVGLVPKLYEIQ